MSSTPEVSAPPLPRFYSVAEVARMFGMSSMTLYRAIAEGGFPAVRVRGRLTIPARAVEGMVEVAVAEHTVVDASRWAVEGVASR